MDENNNGMRLLKKWQKGIFSLIFSRMSIILILLLFNIALLFIAFALFEEFLPHVYGGATAFTVFMVLYLINTKMDPTSKITWLAVIMLLPVFGSLLYIFTQAEIGHRAVKHKLQKIYGVAKETNSESDVQDKLAEKSSGAAAMTKYVSSFTAIPLSENGDSVYFPSGEAMLEAMLDELSKAEKSIYMEYFIVDEGIMWGRILEILARKAKEGVDVRFMYDGTCEFMLLPKSYPKKLASLGIKCRVFAPITPFLSTHYNYRDHRKILTIDGKIAFTGGVNLADEYINEKTVHGHWKDTAIMLKGEAAQGFQRMFLMSWNLEEKDILFPRAEGVDAPEKYNGFALPYHDDPLDDEHLGRQVYIDILNRAERYVSIMTPYLILDKELESAITYTAKRGVEVTIILPGIPDKKIPYALAKTHYSALIASGVKIYEYIPGFLHAKVVVADDREAVVGTINFDYRSLYHHFECAVYLYEADCIEDMVTDFESTASVSRQVTPQSIKKEKLFYKIVGRLMKVVAPLM